MGRAGEKRAVEFLKKKKIEIVKTNFKTHIGEIDIIAKDGQEIVFVEVKTRSGYDYGNPSEAVNGKKREKYFKVATEYLQKEKLLDAPCRFDVIEICDGQINHIINAFCK